MHTQTLKTKPKNLINVDIRLECLKTLEVRSY